MTLRLVYYVVRTLIKRTVRYDTLRLDVYCITYTLSCTTQQIFYVWEHWTELHISKYLQRYSEQTKKQTDNVAAENVRFERRESIFIRFKKVLFREFQTIGHTFCIHNWHGICKVFNLIWKSVWPFFASSTTEKKQRFSIWCFITWNLDRRAFGKMTFQSVLHDNLATNLVIDKSSVLYRHEHKFITMINLYIVLNMEYKQQRHHF